MSGGATTPPFLPNHLVVRVLTQDAGDLGLSPSCAFSDTLLTFPAWRIGMSLFPIETASLGMNDNYSLSQKEKGSYHKTVGSRAVRNSTVLIQLPF